MGKVKNKVYDWKDRLRKGKMLTLVVTLVTIIIILTVFSLIKSRDYRLLAENSYNQAFYELTENVNTTEELLKKALISNDALHSSKILTSIWQEASLAQTNISRLPIEVKDLENANKFLTQVSDYSYSLSQKCFEGNNLTNSDIENLENLHEYSVNLKETINQLNDDLYSSNIKWGELSKKGNNLFSKEGNNISKLAISNIEEDLHQYTGLIYDGAYSENQNEFKGLGLTGDDVSKEEALGKAKEFLGEDRIKEITETGESENGKIPCYTFNLKYNNNQEGSISVSKKGGHVVEFNGNRNVENVEISDEQAITNAKEFLSKRNLPDMKETYFLKENNVLTVNLAYTKDDVIIYPDLIKVKVALDNGEVLGMEGANYLNSHKEDREITKPKITKEEALKKVNPKLEILNVDLAIIPNEANNEIFCYEIKGRIKTKSAKNVDDANSKNNETNQNTTNDENTIKNETDETKKNNEETNSKEEKTTENDEETNDFLVYINAETGKEEDILMIVNTPNGTLTT